MNPGLRSDLHPLPNHTLSDHGPGSYPTAGTQYGIRTHTGSRSEFASRSHDHRRYEGRLWLTVVHGLGLEHHSTQRRETT